ncbi:hypothetical protein IMG5_172620 [Ichthyophthirius multifiliis]|uniref:Cullin family profile domain-containing protein n=1 Tax=Ichthyophthirius multifiliis TaxID=5932 RepID=G0R1T6_ICHMU|nr:hypothetical protein IMG5_172620 [Ichthyophthirius multifiliis]EGR28588.1 hypothetical protein IMG5_172620 [Ichthyophthirius multifiliis]|eukprot:XP_004029824.1 hypothetical protein IMG5_172620 [Ichthyophthirius multifiliis]
MINMVKMDFQTGWKQIEPCIQKLHILLDKQFNGQELEKEDQITTTQYSNTYTIIYNMCLEKQLKNPEQLYEAYKDQIQFFVINKDKSHIEHNNLPKLRYIEWSDTMSCEEYLWNTNNLLEQEKNRFAQALHRFSNTHEQISSIFNDEMIKNYKPILLSKDSGFQYMLINEKTKVLQLVYNLYKKLNDTFEDIRQAFSDYCAQIGQDLINQKIDAHLKEEELEKQQQQTQQNIQKKLLSYAIDYQFVENIFKYFHDINHIINSNFYQDPIFKVSFKNALDRFLNVQIDDYGVPELLANYTDKTLRKGAKENEDEMEKKIDKIIEVFNDLNEKDIFLNLYQSQLAQRLLMEESESIQYEKVMITKIKGCCGQGTEIKNYEGMLNDINLANEYKNNKLKFSLPSPSSQKKFKRETVNENRDHAIEAAIVRIMKSRKQLEFSELATEVNIMMKKFKPKLIQIKKKIESLIEREYIERDSENKNILHYKS